MKLEGKYTNSHRVTNKDKVHDKVHILNM